MIKNKKNNEKKLALLSAVASLTMIIVLLNPVAGAGDFPHNFTVAGHSEIINNAIIQNYNPTDASGTGVFDTFLRIHNSTPITQGYNSDAKGKDEIEFDEDASWTSSWLLTDVPLVLKDPAGPDPAQYYREFQLDINQIGGTYLTLDELEVYVSDDENASNIWMYGYDGVDFNGHASKVWELDSNGNNHWIILNYDLAPGSGKRDLIVWIPDSRFPSGCGYKNPSCTTNVILYSHFGGDNRSQYPDNDGFEEWGVAMYGLISGYKFYDSNMDGTWDLGEPPLQGWEIKCTNESGFIQTTTTDTNGYYQFIVAPGEKHKAEDFIISEVCPVSGGWIQSLPTPTGGCGSGTYVIPLKAGHTASDINFGNYNVGCLEVTKNVDWNGVIPIPDTIFEINVTGPEYPNGHTLTFNKTGTQTLDNILVGEYWINETDPGDEWKVTPGLSQKVTIGPGSTDCISITINNTYDAGCLYITKELWWNGSEPIPGAEFEITIEGPNGYTNSCTVDSNNDECVFCGLQTGYYWINETDPGNDWIVTNLTQQVYVHGFNAAVAPGYVCVVINNTFDVQPGITVRKTADKSIIYPGENITYYYWINNTGNVPLNITSLLDDVLGDILHNYSQLIGDSNNDGWLDPDETWIYSKTQLWNWTKTLFKINLPTDPVVLNVVNGTESYYDLTLYDVPDGYDVTNGHYLCWCLQRDVIMSRNVNHSVTLYSSYDTNLPPIVQSENWSKVNYILNNKNGYSKTAIQDAIWFLINHKSTTNPGALALIQDAEENGENFEPYVGQKIAVIAIGAPQIQRTIFEVELPDYPIINYVEIQATNPLGGLLEDNDSLTVEVRSK